MYKALFPIYTAILEKASTNPDEKMIVDAYQELIIIVKTKSTDAETNVLLLPDEISNAFLKRMLELTWRIHAPYNPEDPNIYRPNYFLFYELDLPKPITDMFMQMTQTYRYGGTKTSLCSMDKPCDIRQDYYHKYEALPNDLSGELLISAGEMMNNVTASLDQLLELIVHIISNATMAELYEILGHRYDPNFKLAQYIKTEKRYYGSNIRDSLMASLRDEVTAFIWRTVHYEIYSRMYAVFHNSPMNAFPLYSTIGLSLMQVPQHISLSMREYPKHTTVAILWAWNYMMLHKPDDNNTIKPDMSEHQACLYLADILPILQAHYESKYSAFHKKYVNPKRKKLFTDQTQAFEEYLNP